MTDNHPITPPLKLVHQWFLGAKAMPVDQWVTDVATQAARWGADQELEACCELLNDFNTYHLRELLRASRRPKPPSLKKRIAAEIENGTACDRESERITRDVIREVAVWIDRLGYRSCAAELRKEVS